MDPAGSKRQPTDHQSDAHPTVQLRPAMVTVNFSFCATIKYS